MSETCKTCRNRFDSGIWLAAQFVNERVHLFCSEKCKDAYLKNKLQRIKVSYPNYYDRILKVAKREGKYRDVYPPFAEAMKKEIK